MPQVVLDRAFVPPPKVADEPSGYCTKKLDEELLI